MSPNAMRKVVELLGTKRVRSVREEAREGKVHFHTADREAWLLRLECGHVAKIPTHNNGRRAKGEPPARARCPRCPIGTTVEEAKKLEAQMQKSPRLTG